MTDLLYYIFATLGGMILGVILCYFTIKKPDTGRLQDELTKARRELATQKRMLNDFFNSSNALFEQLESSYKSYANHMSEQSKKIVPQLGNIFETSNHSHPYVKTEKDNKTTEIEPNQSKNNED